MCLPFSLISKGRQQKFVTLWRSLTHSHNNESAVHFAVSLGLEGKKLTAGSLEFSSHTWGTHTFVPVCFPPTHKQMQLYLGIITYQWNLSEEWTLRALKCVFVCSCKRYPWWGACHYSVKLLLAASFGSQNALLLSWSSRERKREREKVKENNCHGRFIEILVLQCVTAVILTHSTYHFVSGLCSRSHIPFAVMAHSRTTQRLLKCAAGLPWQWLPYTLSLNFSEQTRDIHHSFYFFCLTVLCLLVSCMWPS